MQSIELTIDWVDDYDTNVTFLKIGDADKVALTWQEQCSLHALLEDVGCCRNTKIRSTLEKSQALNKKLTAEVLALKEAPELDMSEQGVLLRKTNLGLRQMVKSLETSLEKRERTIKRLDDELGYNTSAMTKTKITTEEIQKFWAGQPYSAPLLGTERDIELSRARIRQLKRNNVGIVLTLLAVLAGSIYKWLP